MTDEKIHVALEGVPETLLWNLYHRAVAAREADPILADPKAIEMVDRIDYPFERLAQSQGQQGFAGQWQALRVKAFDNGVRRFLDAYPDGTVVALGEGLETQFWRVDNGRVTWLTVELPETAAVRRQLLPDGPRNTTVECSAIDEQWTTNVDPAKGVLVTAQGLLMYFTAPGVDGLIDLCARKFPASALLFDAVPKWMLAAQQRRKQKDDTYQPPAWTWGMDPAEFRRIANLPRVARLDAIHQPRGRGPVFGVLAPLLQAIPGLRWRLPIFPILLARFRAEK